MARQAILDSNLFRYNQQRRLAVIISWTSRPFKFKGGFNQVFRDPTLSNEVHYRKEKERLVRCEMVRDLRVPIPPPVGPQCREHLEVFIKHLSEQASPKLVSLCCSLKLDRIEKVIK